MLAVAAALAVMAFLFSTAFFLIALAGNAANMS
jgi:hypothetical protein